MCFNDGIPLKFDRHLGSAAVELPAKFQSDGKSLNPNLTAPRLHEALRYDVLPLHDDVIKWKHFPRYWPFVRGIHRSPVNSQPKASDAAFDVSFDLRLNKRLSKQSWGWWLETLSCSLWRQSNVVNRDHVSSSADRDQVNQHRARCIDREPHPHKTVACDY